MASGGELSTDQASARFDAPGGPPSSIAEYCQQIGRAGRDGKDSECILLTKPGDAAFPMGSSAG